MQTKAFLKYGHNLDIPTVGKADFKTTCFINISELYANQPLIDSKVLSEKLNGNKKVKAQYLKIN